MGLPDSTAVAAVLSETHWPPGSLMAWRVPRRRMYRMRRASGPSKRPATPQIACRSWLQPNSIAHLAERIAQVNERRLKI
jgi:hypothetical protein